jgi:hypothetical protein
LTEATVPEQQTIPDEAVQALTRFLQAEWAGPYMARASNFTREEVLAGALAAADAEAGSEAEAVTRRGLMTVAPFIRAPLEAENARLREVANREQRDRGFWAINASRERQRLKRERDEARAENARLREALTVISQGAERQLGFVAMREIATKALGGDRA